MENNIEKTGYIMGVIGVALALIWIGIFKFTPTEAKAIEPLVSNHFAMSWMYGFLSVQTVSIIIGVVEIIVGLGLLASFFNREIGKYAGIFSSVIFLATLSFLLTTPNTWKTVDGVITTNFFLLKDICFLGISLMVVGKNTRSDRTLRL